MKTGLYEGGIFKIEVDLSTDKCKDYPFVPPKVKMLTKIWHPNISCDGDSAGAICHNYLKADECSNGEYNPILGLSGVMNGLLLMFDVDESGRSSCAFNADDPLNVEAAREYTGNPEQFYRKAREWTRKFAK